MPQTQPSTLRTKERREQTDPVFFYIFDKGGTLYHLASYSEDISITSLPAALGSDPQVFTSAQIAHDRVEQEAFSFSPEIAISVGIKDNSFADELVKHFIVPQSDIIEATIFRTNHENVHGSTALDFVTDGYVFFKGQKSSVSIKDRTITVAVKSLARSEKRNLPRMFYQTTCNYNLGDAFCTVNIDSVANKLATTVTSIDRTKKSVVIADTLINGVAITESTFQAGLLRELDAPGGNVISTMGIDAVEDLSPNFRLRLNWISDSLVDGTNTDLEVIQGCNKTTTACNDKFANLANFGGTPYIPDENPALEGIET